MDAAAVREVVSLGLDALDETLKLNLASGWYRLTGDKNFAVEQADFHGLTEKRKNAIALFAGMTAEKYQAAVQYLPELGLLVAAGGYGFGWLVAFNKLKQAMQLAGEAKKKKAETAAPTADKPADKPA